MKNRTSATALSAAILRSSHSDGMSVPDDAE